MQFYKRGCFDFLFCRVDCSAAQRTDGVIAARVEEMVHVFYGGASFVDCIDERVYLVLRVQRYVLDKTGYAEVFVSGCIKRFFWKKVVKKVFSYQGGVDTFDGKQG